MTRLTEQISEAEAAFQAAKSERNAAQDMRKEAWRKESELKDAVNKATAEFDRAFQVGVLRHQPRLPNASQMCWPHNQP